VIDPESLVLLSLAFRNEERRLTDLLRWWAREGAPLTNVQRMRTLADQLGERSGPDFALFSRWATQEGHRSWARYASDEPDAGAAPVRRSKGLETLVLVEPATLMVRLRAAFGVNAKADVLVFLIGLRGAMATVAVISRALGYTQTAVREAVKDMATARLIQETSDRPASYSTYHRPWVDLLELASPGAAERGVGPAWGMWTSLFALLTEAYRLAPTASAGANAEHVAASAARDAIERHAYGLNFHGIPVPQLERYPGRELAKALLATLENVSEKLVMQSGLETVARHALHHRV
jgi:hypothetical protein